MLLHKISSNTSLKKLEKLVTSTNALQSAKLYQMCGSDSWPIPVRLKANLNFLEIAAKNWVHKESYNSHKLINLLLHLGKIFLSDPGTPTHKKSTTYTCS